MNPHMTSSAVRSQPLTSSSLSATLWLLCLALALTIVGAAAGVTFALPIVSSGWIFGLFFLELGIIWTAPKWTRSAPLNIVLFALFPLLSGLTLAPIIMMTLTGYVNGATILLNALIATTLLCASSAVLASVTGDLGSTIGRFLFQSLIGLIVFGLLQIFFPSLRGPGFEMILSGVGIVVFSLFLTYDLQRLSRRSESDSPFLLAISLYLDIYNLFLYVLRFMLAISGNRR
jgi:modulator of FtsH protease